VSINGISRGRGNDDDSVDFNILNENQRIIFNRIESYYNSILIGNQVEALRMIIMGTAEIEKSYLIRTIKK